MNPIATRRRTGLTLVLVTCTAMAALAATPQRPAVKQGPAQKAAADADIAKPKPPPRPASAPVEREHDHWRHHGVG